MESGLTVAEEPGVASADDQEGVDEVPHAVAEINNSATAAKLAHHCQPFITDITRTAAPRERVSWDWGSTIKELSQ